MSQRYDDAAVTGNANLGHTFGNQASSHVGAEHTTSTLAYAESLAAMTSRLEDLKWQATKAESFTAWSGMKVNCSKCAVTGVHYGDAETGVKISSVKQKHSNSATTLCTSNHPRDTNSIPSP